MKLLLKISFLGTAYCGYQVQNNAVTIQQIMNETAERIFGFECDIVGCSRTDSGVHANCFCLTVSKKGCNSLEHSIPLDKIPIAFNSLLPDDISVIDAIAVSSDFHARYDVKYKEYVYKIWNGRFKNPFLGDRAFKCPIGLSGDDIERMNRAAERFVGKHDFVAFMAKGSKIVDTTRQVFYSSVESDGDMIIFRVAADGFLYNMVRIMVGTLIDVARGNLSEEDIDKIILSGSRSNAGATAPACGLYLNKVSYEEYNG